MLKRGAEKEKQQLTAPELATSTSIYTIWQLGHGRCQQPLIHFPLHKEDCPGIIAEEGYRKSMDSSSKYLVYTIAQFWLVIKETK